MSNWKYWPPIGDQNTVNFQLGKVESTGKFVYPNLRDEHQFVLASDYSGEHQKPEFQVLSFLLTRQSSVFGPWEAARLSVRNKHLSDGRRMAFKSLNDALRINALLDFLDAASLLEGVLVCVAVEKAHSIRNWGDIPPLRYNWTPDTLEKLLRICVFGSGFVDGLRGERQDIYWITDDDAIVATEDAKADATTLMGSFIHRYAGENPMLYLGIGSLFNDGLRAEDLLAIPDLAGGACSECLTLQGKSNIPTSEVGREGIALVLQTKTMLINLWRSDNSKPLKHFDLLVRVAEDGQTLFSFRQPIVRIPEPGEVLPKLPEPLNEKWRKALTDWLNRHQMDGGQPDS
jgi:hypothetical protein